MAVGSDSTLQPQPGIFNRPPMGLYHILRRNNYPDTAFNHDLSNALEAGPLFISVDCFLCDPQGFTCITLHFYTIFLKCSPAIPERAGKKSFRSSMIQKRRRFRWWIEPWLKSGKLTPVKIRQVTYQIIARKSIQTPIAGV
jgi:hypothetical protein